MLCGCMYIFVCRSVIGIRDALIRLYDDSTSTHKVQDVQLAVDSLNSTIASTISTLNSIASRN